MNENFFTSIFLFLESASIQDPDLSNDDTNLEFTSNLTRGQPEIQQATSSINVETSNISGPRRPQPQTGTPKKRMFSFSIVRNIFKCSSVS